VKKYIFGCFLLLCGTVFAEDLPILGLAHVGFMTSNLERARAFYHGVLGYDEAFDLKKPDGSVAIAYFKVNEDQYIEIAVGAPRATAKLMMTHFSMQTDNIEKLHKMLVDRGLTPGNINYKAKDGNLSFAIRNAPAQSLEFVEFTQYQPESWHRKTTGKFLSDRRISTHLEHTGIIVTDFEAARHFYVDQMGFNVRWSSKAPDGKIKLIHLGLPGASGDYVEFGNGAKPPEGRWIGVSAHIALSVPDTKPAYQLAQDRGYADQYFKAPIFGGDQRWQLNLYDPDGTRVECLSPIEGKKEN
jgi:lactoylglutathione lyase